MGKKITYLDEISVKNVTAIVRVDCNVSLDGNRIADDARIKQSLPTIQKLLAGNNRIVLLSHLGRPEGYDSSFSLRPVVKRLRELLPKNSIVLYKDIESLRKGKEQIRVLENIRFFSGEQGGKSVFSRELASLGDVYINDGFGVCHRTDASVTGIPKYLPAYGGLLLKKELEMIDLATRHPKSPVVAIVGGAKVSTKIGLIGKLAEISDFLIIGGGLANTFVCAKGLPVGTSFCEYEAVQSARKLLRQNGKKRAKIILPADVVIASKKESKESEVVKIDDIPARKAIYDFGPESIAQIGSIIASARTIIWNGPIGYCENPAFRRGTEFVYYAIAQNEKAISIVGGGDTLAAIPKEEYLGKITHISTGGGAMLELIEKGTLPGIDALRKNGEAKKH